MEDEQKPTGQPHFVGKKDELIEAKRSNRTIEGRDVLVIHHQGVFFALDSYCYHAAGLLMNGDIEDINGKLCIVCPKHKYKITLAEGEGLYKSKDPSQPNVPIWCSKGVKQRTHTVTESNGDVYVTLSQEEGRIDSDYYQGEKGKAERAKLEAEEKKKEKKS